LVESLRELLRLQQTHTQMEETEKQIADIPTQRAQALDRRERARVALETARELLHEQQREERRLETGLSDKEALCKKLESQSYEITSNHAYRAMLHEIEEARAYISEHETAVLERMDAIEEAERALAAREAEASETELQAARRQSDLDTEERALNEKLARLAEIAEARAKSIEPALLKRYESLKLRRTPVVAVMGRQGSSCPKCRIELQLQVVLNLRNGEDMTTCPSCDRIVVSHHVLNAVTASRST
jgi:predicted  nucleic acid-binding Zn-ribbon protein